MRNAPPGFDVTGQHSQQTEHGPAVLVPLAWLQKWPGLYALVCAWRCVQRRPDASAGHVMRESVLLMGKCIFAGRTARRALEELRKCVDKK